jgi:imidazole glycerol-phosphate synthase subunit HisH
VRGVSNKITIGIVDYDVGNHASVWRVLHMLGYRCRVSKEPKILADSDMIVLPGVGAFPKAMDSLRQYGLDEFLKESAESGKPFLGVCLGMQLLADASEEQSETIGLGLIPGRVVPIGPGQWHIGWNEIEVESDEAVFRASDKQVMYFNHSFHFQSQPEHCVAVTRLNKKLTAIVRRGNVVGIQFHPEKSQVPGHALLKSVVEGFRYA